MGYRYTQHYIDKTTVWVRSRWVAAAVMLVVYALRIYIIQGFFVVTYALGIYLLNLLIGFVSPAVDPETENVLPVANNEEFRPFSRKLPEFKFWLSAFRAIWVAIVATFFQAFDVPVFWPILLIYFFMLVFITAKERIRHMIKFQYVPFSLGQKKKKVFKATEDKEERMQDV